MTGPVTLGIEQHVATITMNDPARRNALGPDMLAGLMRALDSAASCRAVILRAAPGSTVWCAGFDIKELRPGLDPLAQDGPLQALFHAISGFPAPVIALLNGSAWGGGTDLALRCDIAIATPACTLAFTPARLGLPYDTDGLLNMLLRGGMALAIEMFAAAEPIPAARIAANAPLSVASAKQQLRALNAALPLPAAKLQRLLEGRRQALNSQDFAEGLAAFAEKRRPIFTGK